MSDQEQAGRAPAGDGRGALRVSHEDRDQVAEALRVAAGDGRLSSDELDERLERGLTARTYDELAGLAAVLGGGVAPAPAKELIKIRVTSGHSQRVGRWTVPARMDLYARSGHIKLDFTEAVITQPTLHIDAEVSSGHIVMVT